MDSLDLFFKKYAYKFDKGYPDMDNDQDVLLLETLLDQLILLEFEEIQIKLAWSSFFLTT